MESGEEEETEGDAEVVEKTGEGKRWMEENEVLLREWQEDSGEEGWFEEEEKEDGNELHREEKEGDDEDKDEV